MYGRLIEISKRPAPYERLTPDVLWTDEHISRQMLRLHLDPESNLASRKLSFIEKSIDWMHTRFRIDSGLHIADFGCGPGLYATRLAARGADVTAIDFSRRSLRFAEETAKAQGLAIDFVLENYLEYESDQRFDLILLIYCDFCALSPPQRESLLRIFHRLLREDGVVLLDVCSMPAFDLRREETTYGHRLMDGFWAAEDYCGFKHTFKYETKRVVLDKYTIVTQAREFEIYNWLQYYDRDALLQEFAKSGFRIQSWYASVAGDAYCETSLEMAVVAEKAE